MEKKIIVVLFGGQSTEHEVSCMSAETILTHINKEEYKIILIGITKEGNWLLAKDKQAISDGSWRTSTIRAVISPDCVQKAVLLIDGDSIQTVKIDVVFPALHGLYGEDGTVQGLLELAGIPYVGCGVLSSAVCMDKFFTKLIVDTLDIRQARYVPVFKRQLSDIEPILDKIEAALSYPVFVKPSCAGSSKGVSKAAGRQELIKALQTASQHDFKILVEETIIGRELECAVYSDGTPMASGVGEILAAAEFYDYEAKYHNPESRTILSPLLPDGKEAEIRRAAARIFRAVDGFGLARVDFFLEQESNEVIFNEINTLPGFTSISMYPMLFETAGINKKELIRKLIHSAFAREVHYDV